MRLVFLGPPGAGKGTQAKRLAEEKGLLHLSTGDMFRDAIARGTPVGKRAKGFMDAGQLVPDEVVDALVAERLSQADARDGFILDGYPRNLRQAEVLDRRPERLDAVLFLDVADEVLVSRLQGRSGQQQRADDREEVVRERLRVYREHTSPLVDYYRHKGLLVEVDGDRSVDAVAAAVRDALGGLER